MQILTADISDVGDLVALRDDLARWILSRGIEQWKPGELPKTWVEHQVERGWVHIVRENQRLVATVTVVPEDPIVWGDRKELAGYVHRLMVDRRCAGHGVGAYILAWAEREMRKSDRAIARLDCVRSNRQLRSYYENNGYTLVGYKDFPDVEWARETALYEKALVQPHRCA